jgi:HlyD family secretion protein
LLATVTADQRRERAAGCLVIHRDLAHLPESIAFVLAFRRLTAIIRRMIKNPPRLWGLSLLLLSSAGVGCDQAGARQPDPLQGVVEYDDRVIGFEPGGRVLEVSVERGDVVKLGQPLAKIDDGLVRPELALRQAELAAAQAQARLLRKGARSEDLRASEADIAALQAQEQTLAKNLDREKTLHAQGAAPAATIDDLTAQLQSTSEKRRALEQRLKALRGGARSDELDAADARVAGAQAAIALVDARLARFALASPAAGDVIDVHVKVGELVAPGSPAITLADLSHPFVDVMVPQGKLQGVAVGAAVDLRADGVGQALRGTVEHVFPQTEFTPRYLFSKSERPNLVVRVRVRVDDPKHALHAGVPAFVTLAGRS